MTFSSRQPVHQLLLVAALCCVTPFSFAQPVRVLLMPGAATPWSIQFTETLRKELLRQHPRSDLHLEVLPETADPAAAGTQLPRWLIEKYAGLHYSAIVPVLPEQLPFALAMRDRLWPLAPVVASGLDTAKVVGLRKVPLLTGLLQHDTVARNLELMFSLMPDARHIGVIAASIDTDPIRPNWRARLQPWLGRAGLIELSGLEADEVLSRVQRLPPRAMLYFAAPGITHNTAVITAQDLVRSLAPVSRAPIFADVTTLLGSGAVGGWMVSPEAHARDVASHLNRLLAGVPAKRIGFEPHTAPRLQFDWRALQRWGIDSSALPPGSELLFQPPGLWEAYREIVIGTVLVLALQSGLIISLRLERRRRRQAERKSRQHLCELARLDRIGALGALSAALAHEINQPLGAILSNAETAEVLLEAAQPSLEDLRELIAAIREDDQRAAAVLTRLRAWIGNNTSHQQGLALNPLLNDVARILRVEVSMRDTELVLQLGDRLPEVIADGVQIQQVILNLVLNALDALQQVAPEERRVTIRTCCNPDGGVDISVADSGDGLGDLPPDRVFEPFFSTKENGLGVGLSISRSIVERHGGTLWVEQPGWGGAVFHFSLPAAPAALT